jgi:transposase
MRILVAVEPVDGRKGIDGLAALCKQRLSEDPFSGCIFVFRTRRGMSIRLLTYDGQGFWLAQKRLSQGRFRTWPQGDAASYALEYYQAHVLLAAGNPAVAAAPVWRAVRPKKLNSSEGTFSAETKPTVWQGAGGGGRTRER